MEYNLAMIRSRDGVVGMHCEQDVDINAIFLKFILDELCDDCALLDVGTGNGFVLQQINRLSGRKIRLYGIDQSVEMVKIAKDCLRGSARILCADVNNIPFNDCTFNVVTAKNVTRINAAEIFRVLRCGGSFIFREYGLGKGVVEMAEIFEGRLIRQRKPEYYAELLQNAGFNIDFLKKYQFTRRYRSPSDLVEIAKSFPLIENFSLDDEKRILSHFANNATITSDPFILLARKLESEVGQYAKS